MKKIILLLTIVFVSALSVMAADNITEKITLKDIKLSNYELAPYEGVIEIDYELVPNDVESKGITWTISGVQKGVVVDFKDGATTNKAVGIMTLEVKNSNETDSNFRITAKSGKITKTVTVKVENQKATETRYKEEVVKEIEALIDEVKKIDEKNVDAVEKAINKIEVMLKNEEVKNSVKPEMMESFNQIKEKLETFKSEEKRDYTKVGIISALAIAFLFGLYMIFKSNTPKKDVTKPNTKKEDKNKKKK